MGKRRSPEATENVLAKKSSQRAVRLLMLVDLLRRRRHGIGLQELTAALGVRRNAVYEYLTDLEAAGLPLDRTPKNGEAWAKLTGDWLVAPSAAEMFALMVAAQTLKGLPGSSAHQWLAPRLRQLTTPKVSVDALVPDGLDADAITRAVSEGRRLRFAYRGIKDDVERVRLVEPIELRLRQRAWYLYALDVDRDETRTFKLTRLTNARVLDEPCALIARIDPDREHALAVDVWTSKDAWDVVVRVHGPSARVVREYPLTKAPRYEDEGDAVVVRARVSGLEEVTRWVLRWGGAAEVLEPPALIERIRTEVRQMQGWLERRR